MYTGSGIIGGSEELPAKSRKERCRDPGVDREPQRDLGVDRETRVHCRRTDQARGSCRRPFWGWCPLSEISGTPAPCAPCDKLPGTKVAPRLFFLILNPTEAAISRDHSSLLTNPVCVAFADKETPLGPQQQAQRSRDRNRCHRSGGGWSHRLPRLSPLPVTRPHSFLPPRRSQGGQSRLDGSLTPHQVAPAAGHWEVATWRHGHEGWASVGTK